MCVAICTGGFEGTQKETHINDVNYEHALEGNSPEMLQ